MTFPKACLMAVVLMSAGSMIGAAPGGAGSAAGRPAGRGAARVPANTHQAMESMDRVYKLLVKEATDPAKKDASLKNVALLQLYVAISKTNPPMPVISKLPADKQAAALEDYRLMMNGLHATFVELETAIAEGKAEEIKKAFKEVDEMMKKGHEQFVPEH